MPEKPTGGTTAYLCECGKKWVFPKAAAATRKRVQRLCKCGRTLVLDRGLIYSLPPRQDKIS